MDPFEEEVKNTLSLLISECYINAIQKGFYESPVSIPEGIVAMHAELSEAYESDRNGEFDIEELADVVLYIFSFCGYKRLNLPEAIINKMKKNKSREYKHGKEY